MTQGHNFCPYTHLLTVKYAAKIALPAARLNRQKQTISRGIERVGVVLISWFRQGHQTTSPRHQSLLPNLCGQPNAVVVSLQSHLTLRKPALAQLQTVRRLYVRAVKHRTDLLANRTTRSDDTISSRITKMVRKVKPQKKTHFFGLDDPISIICFLTTLKFSCDTKRIHKGAAMWVLPFLLKKHWHQL